MAFDGAGKPSNVGSLYAKIRKMMKVTGCKVEDRYDNETGNCAQGREKWKK